MLTNKQIQEIRDHLEKAQNPIFYFDNDADGLCSFVLLRRYLGRGKGVAVRSFPDLNVSYARKAQELNADYVFILDKPVVSKEFVEEIDSLGLPIVWIDHHDVESEDLTQFSKNLFIYNPAKSKGSDRSEEPVTYLSYKVANRKEDAWIAIIGCIADHYLPPFVNEFEKQYPDFWGKVQDPFDAYYKTEIGKIAQAFNFGIKDSITNVVKLQNFLISCQGPTHVFSETYHNATFRKRYMEIKTKYKELLEKAKRTVSGKLIFFEYSGELSISADLSNELSYIYPKKYVIVSYKKDAVANLSMRGKNVKKLLEKVLKDFDNASGGGHEDAVGARLRTSDLTPFKEKFLQEIGG